MRILSLFIILSLFLSCDTNPNQGKPDTNSSQPQNALHAEALKEGASASTIQNMTDGYWHIGGAVNFRGPNGEKKNEGYVGKWLKFHKNMTVTYGQNENDIETSYWFYDDEGDYMTMKSENGKEFFYNHWKCRMVGDIILLIGNTPQNPLGTQIKLVRKPTKIVEENPN